MRVWGVGLLLGDVWGVGCRAAAAAVHSNRGALFGDEGVRGGCGAGRDAVGLIPATFRSAFLLTIVHHHHHTQAAGLPGISIVSEKMTYVVRTEVDALAAWSPLPAPTTVAAPPFAPPLALTNKTSIPISPPRLTPI